MLKFKPNQDEPPPDLGPLKIRTKAQTKRFVNLGAEDIEAINDAWQKYAGKRYKNVMVSKEE